MLPDALRPGKPGPVPSRGRLPRGGSSPDSWGYRLVAGLRYDGVFGGVGLTPLVAFPAAAGVSAEQAARLDADLTPLGAERAGNGAGTIPAWTGGITEPPPGYAPGGAHPDPHPGDAVRFEITAGNWEQHADHLSEGQKALLRAYPETWRVPVYPARRSASYPQWVYEALKANLFIGPPDRFEWTLLGKRELYIPYNSYRLHGDDVGAEDILRTGHINPELARYELHRVWVVEGVLKQGQNHVYSRRVFHVDEDSWQIAVADLYDSEGEIWRVAEAHALNYYEVPVLWSTLEVHHDLKEERYFVSGLDNGRNPPVFADEGDPREFSPNALSYYIR